MKKLLLFFILILLSFNIYANSDKILLEKANKFYKNGEYEKALKIYKKVEADKKNSALFYNMGNIYFKMKNYPYAKFYYLKALKIAPSDKQIYHNLLITEQFLKKTGAISKKISNNFFVNIKNGISINFLLLLTLFFIFLFSGLFYFKGKNINGRTLYSLILLLLILILFDAVKLSEYYKKEYVFLKKEAIVKSAPGKSSINIFSIYGGTDFKILRKSDDGWIKIILPNGYSGWIQLKKNEDYGEI